MPDYFAFGHVPLGFGARALLLPWRALEASPVREAVQLLRELGDPLADARGAVLHRPLRRQDDGPLLQAEEHYRRAVTEAERQRIALLEHWADAEHALYGDPAGCAEPLYDWVREARWLQGEQEACQHLIDTLRVDASVREFVVLSEAEPSAPTLFRLRCWWAPADAAVATVQALLEHIGLVGIQLSSSNYGFVATPDQALHDTLRGKQLKAKGCTVTFDK